MTMPKFQTFGTTGTRKNLKFDDTAINVRAMRRAATLGIEFNDLKSLFCGLGSMAGASFRRYAERKPIKFFEPTGDFSKTIELFNIEKPEGILSSPSELLKYARATNRTHKFKYIRSSSALILPEVAQEIMEKLAAPGASLFVTYGMTEMGTVFRGTFADAIRIPGCVGMPVDGVEFAIDPDGQIRFKVKKEHGAADKYENKKLTDKHFKIIDGVKWFYPGDTARMEGDLLVLHDRAEVAKAVANNRANRVDRINNEAKARAVRREVNLERIAVKKKGDDAKPKPEGTETTA